MRLLSILFTLTLSAQAQWTIQAAATTADLRGIDSVGKGIAWASGTNGTVLRTEDGGYLWQRCTVPPGAEKLDFRGIQAFDENTAIVMSSGKGDLSRLYKTNDGCQTWKLVFTNPDKDGFWDALALHNQWNGFLLGDPVGGSFYLARTEDKGETWTTQQNPGLYAEADAQGAFAASNSSVALLVGGIGFATGGAGGSFFYHPILMQACGDACSEEDSNRDGKKNVWERTRIPVGNASEESGVFSLDFRCNPENWRAVKILVAVGGDYKHPDSSARTAAFTLDQGETWTASTHPPHGYRSAVAFDDASNTWITVGPNGTDISTDNGKNWRALKPGPGDAPDADQHWNALSLPFVVGPHGRIGLLEPDALKAKTQ
ncbi:hypothetical protein GOB94_02785 [Granulicella sp. 5B5]|uniref:WD40/YVTN/BNR-like repeat-containing protein n=1 Tax=Granulicella sp. 5B5 TaxID=1617967 RepID=UPI0015F6534E|nr:hypothetical protein [Granulicella sp. 5B5]QMV17741.1 hypothetical protein GOB94_02785 [Granulicella sp. 5B5]